MAKQSGRLTTAPRAAKTNSLQCSVTKDRHSLASRWRWVALGEACALLGLAVTSVALVQKLLREAAPELSIVVEQAEAIKGQSFSDPSPGNHEPANGEKTPIPEGSFGAKWRQATSSEFRQDDSAEPAPRPIGPFKKRDRFSADQLAKQLLRAPEVGFQRITTEDLFRDGTEDRNKFPHPPPRPLLTNDQLSGLPVRMGLDCHLGKEETESLQVLSRKLRGYLSDSVSNDGIDTRIDASFLRGKLIDGDGDARGDWKQAEAIPTLLQLLQAEGRPLRLLLVEMLSNNKCRSATTALAQRALFDLSDEVREAAVRALADRPRKDYRELLLEGLRYPWPAVADHAAEALVALNDRGALGRLVQLLDRPSPSAPYLGPQSRQRVVPEVVRVNHLKNCMMCHAPSYKPDDPIRGRVPDPSAPLTPRVSSKYYNNSNDGPAIFVRADITYLKQDFAVFQQVADHGPWPAYQRFDYLVRTRPATAQEELDAARRRDATPDYSQRQSVLFALRELTGEDAGSTAAEWRPAVAKLLSQAGKDNR